MLHGIKSLIAVEKLGTVSEAAVALRLTQSAVSKRIQALERELGYALVERDGRRLRLTPAAGLLLAKARPLLAELESLRFAAEPSRTRRFSLGIADSIAGSWGPGAVRRALREIPGLELELHAHRSTLILEQVKLGRYDLGLVAGGEAEGLVSAPIAKEEILLLGEGRTVLTIEAASATWKEIGEAAGSHPRLRGRRFEFVESFSAAAQMAREGFGAALVPAGVARALAFPQNRIASLSPRLSRRVQLVCRKTVWDQTLVQGLAKALPAACRP